jgi:diaminopimelate decarboxylase
VKANGNLALLARLARLGAGADIVSGGELARALRAGIPPSHIVFSGVGKTDAEIAAALEAGVRSLHVESRAEIDAVEALAAQRGMAAPISLRLNPDVDPETHPYIATGLRKAKFGLEIDAARALLPRILTSRNLKLEGLACHIGSQVGSPSALRDAIRIVGSFAVECVRAGAPLRSLDAGGGWPVHYGDEQSHYPPTRAYGEAVLEGLARSGAEDLALDLILEPGRVLVAAAGLLLTRVIFVKTQYGKRFVIVDAGMNDLIRPALYQAYHGIQTVRQAPRHAPLEPADVVGPICESGDFLALNRPLPPIERGDLLVVQSAGAYAASMASNYNSRTRAAEVLVEGDVQRLIRKREQPDDLWQHEILA